MTGLAHDSRLEYLPYLHISNQCCYDLPASGRKWSMALVLGVCSDTFGRFLHCAS